MEQELLSIWHKFMWVGHEGLAGQGLWWLDAIRDVIRVLIGVLFILTIVPPLVWFERRLLGWMQQRQGPNRVGPQGLLQPIADGIKLLLKEDIIPFNVDKLLYITAPIVMLIPALVTAGVIPWSPGAVWGAGAPKADIGVLYMLAWGSLAVYGIVLAGWSSNNKYALLGGLRSSAQMISYELAMGVSIVTIALMSQTTSVRDIVLNQSTSPWFGFFDRWHVFQFFPMGALACLIYSIAMLAETNRAPFDLPEAETEIIAGYHIEYTSMKFAMFFMGEYANMVVVSAINATLFFGGYTLCAPIDDFSIWGIHILAPLVLIAKIIIGLYVFIWIRATLPRLRYDMLMEFGWKGLLPISLVNLLCVAVALTFGYLVGVATWLVIAVATIVVVASLKSTKEFTTKTRRASTVQLFGTAQPYVVGSGVVSIPELAESEYYERRSEELVK